MSYTAFGQKVNTLNNGQLFSQQYAQLDTLEKVDSVNIGQNRGIQYLQKTNLVAVNILGPTGFASISYSKFTTPQFNSEIGLGLIGFYGGIKYHKWIKFGKNKDIISPYTGFIYTHSSYLRPDTTGLLILNEPTGGIYLPLGLHYIGSDGFSLAAELAKIWLLDSDIGSFEERSFYFVCLKIGYLF